MNTPQLKEFIHEHSELFWHIPEDKKANISHELLVETILNYGDISDIKKLFRLIKNNTLQAVFSNLKGRQKLNYYPEIFNFMKLLLTKNAHRNIES